MFKRFMEICSEVWLWLYLRNMVSVVVVVSLLVGVPAILKIKNNYYASIEGKGKVEQTYTIKILNPKSQIIDSKASIITLYQNKKVELKDGFVYVCDPASYSCLGDKSSVIIGSNVILEPEN